MIIIYTGMYSHSYTNFFLSFAIGSLLRINMKLISDLFSQRGKVAPIYPQRRKSQIKKKGQQQSAWKSIASEIFYEYADNTKLNGFYYLKRNVSKGYVR